MIEDHKPLANPKTLDASVIEMAIRMALLGLLLFWSLTIIRPFLGTIAWSVVLAVSLYPAFNLLAKWLGGRRKVAAALITIGLLLIVCGPTMWLGMDFVQGVGTIYERLASGALTVPPPAPAVKTWPLVGEPLFQLWGLASANLKAAFVKVAPHLKPLGDGLLTAAGGAFGGILQFFASVIIAGFLLLPGPSLVGALSDLLRRLVSERGDAFIELAGATIRNVSQGVIGVSLLQALLAGIGLMVADVPGASLIAFLVFILAIIQIGPSLILIPVVIWAWITMETAGALLFTAYMVPVNLMDNVLRPIIMTRGLKTPMVVIIIGVLGGTISNGLIGLFVGPVVLAVGWDLIITWMREDPAVPAIAPPVTGEVS